MPNSDNTKTLFTFNDVPVKAKPPFWLLVGFMWGLFIWLARRRKPERPLSQNILVATLSLPLAFLADIGHAMAHTESAKHAGAPMDEILLSADMPRTLYADNDVEPHTHITRAIGGPIYSAIGFTISLLWRNYSLPDSLSRELADVSSFYHGAIFFGSLLPLPIVDGGTILKWSLVDQGHAPAEADEIVKIAGPIVIGMLAVVGTAIFLLRQTKPKD